MLVPKSAPVEKRGLVMAFHGMGGSPDEMLRYGAALAEHRGEVWCAYRASGAEDGRRAWVPARDYKGIAEMLRYVVEAYKVEPGKAIGFGFSMGGLTALNVCPADKALYAGFVTCAGTGVPGESGGDCAGMRVVVVLGTKDGNFAQLDRWRPAIAKAGPGIATWIVTDLDHELPDVHWRHDQARAAARAVPRGSARECFSNSQS